MGIRLEISWVSRSRVQGSFCFCCCFGRDSGVTLRACRGVALMGFPCVGFRALGLYYPNFDLYMLGIGSLITRSDSPLFRVACFRFEPK